MQNKNVMKTFITLFNVTLINQNLKQLKCETLISRSSCDSKWVDCGWKYKDVLIRTHHFKMRICIINHSTNSTNIRKYHT